ncbi:hypothetical protein D3C73_1495880 [compost metagenome]
MFMQVLNRQLLAFDLDAQIARKLGNNRQLVLRNTVQWHAGPLCNNSGNLGFIDVRRNQQPFVL